MKEFLSNSWVVSIVSGIIVFFLTNTIIIFQNKRKHKKQINTKVINKSRGYVIDNKSWHKKLHDWMPTIAAICTILGISIFGDKSLFNNEYINDSEINSENNDINIGDQSPVINGSGDIIINYGDANQDNELSSNSNNKSSYETNTEEEYHKGTITKTGWESKFIGLRYTNPEGMTMSTEEELNEMNKFEDGTPSIIFDEDELGLARLITVVEMASMSDDKSIYVGVCVERLIDETDVFQFIETFEAQMTRDPFRNYKLISDDETVKIGNDDYIMVSYIISFNHVFRYQNSYFRVVNDRVIMILFNFNNEKARDNILDAFTAY